MASLRGTGDGRTGAEEVVGDEHGVTCMYGFQYSQNRACIMFEAHALA